MNNNVKYTAIGSRPKIHRTSQATYGPHININKDISTQHKLNSLELHACPWLPL